MNIRIRAATVAAFSALAFVPGSAQAGVLSLLPGSCTNQPASQPFAQWSDYSSYTPVAGGSFEAGTTAWTLTGGATIIAGNETFYSNTTSDSHSLSLPAGSSATSPASCTDLYHPTARLFVRNGGSASSRLTVQALYPGLLGSVQIATIGQLTASTDWQPSPAMGLLVTNLLATVSLSQTSIAFRFRPDDSTGQWQIDDVYLDPYGRG